MESAWASRRERRHPAGKADNKQARRRDAGAPGAKFFVRFSRPVGF
jgi:hypothetical protein